MADEVPYEQLVQHLLHSNHNNHPNTAGGGSHNNGVNTAALMRLRFINLVDMSEEVQRRLTASVSVLLYYEGVSTPFISFLHFIHHFYIQI